MRFPLCKHLIAILSTGVFFSGCLGVEGSLRYWPAQNSILRHIVRSQSKQVIREGYIVTKNNDTINGMVRVNTYNDYSEATAAIPILPKGKTKSSDIAAFPLSDINIVAVKYRDGIHYKFYAPFRSNLWQIVAQNGQSAIYLQNWWEAMNDAIIASWPQMMLVSGNNATEVRLYTKSGLMGESRMILKFINNRYQAHFTKKDFKNRQEMLNYIVKREAN